MKYQQILTMSTYGSSLRSEAFGWSMEDGSNIKIDQSIPIGLASKDRSKALHNLKFNYDCVVRAMADGWRVMAPPTDFILGASEICCYEWWLERMV